MSTVHFLSFLMRFGALEPLKSPSKSSNGRYLKHLCCTPTRSLTTGALFWSLSSHIGRTFSEASKGMLPLRNPRSSLHPALRSYWRNLHYVRNYWDTFLGKICRNHLKSVFFDEKTRKNTKISSKIMKFDEISSKKIRKNAQIAPKRRKNEVFVSGIRFETVSNRKNH